MKHRVANPTKVLLVNPELPFSFWSFRETNRVLGGKALLPPLGLITVAAPLPREWRAELNCGKASNRDS